MAVVGSWKHVNSEPVKLAAGPTPCSRCFVNHSAETTGTKWKNFEANESWEEFSAALVSPRTSEGAEILCFG